MFDVLALPEPERRLVNWMLRQGRVGLVEIATFLELEQDAAHTILAPLIAQGFVQEVKSGDEVRFRVRLLQRRR